MLGANTIASVEDEIIGTESFLNNTDSEEVAEPKADHELIKNIITWVGEEAKDFILKNVVHLNLFETLFVSTTTRFNIDNQTGIYQNIVNLKRINDIQYVNKFFESINSKILKGGIFISYVETDTSRKKRILRKYFWGLNYIFYSLDFILKRVFPKLSLTKGIYFFLTRNQNRVMSKAETFGRLYSCGFKLKDELLVENHLFFAAQKIKKPAYDLHPTYGPFVKLRRVGKGGKIFNVYKLRTMHPYAEYLQGYIHEQNNLDKGGKFKDDFRINTIGKFLRKFWLDELPMLYNWLKGDVKLVGVRPLSQHYFNLYCTELQQKRIKYKPGLIPPFYADLPKTLDEIQESELRYLNSFEQKPLRTNIAYLFRAMKNIIFKRARSK